jgi:hypothetical protein
LSIQAGIKDRHQNMENNLEQNDGSIEDNLSMVNYIMLHRIYDMLTIIANKVDPDKTSKMIEHHENGYLLGPAPAYTSEEQSE